MYARLAPALLLLGAVTAQVTPSVVTFQSISPVPTTEGVFTIQTSVPGGVTSEGSMGIPPGETPIPSSLLSTTGSGSVAPPASASASTSASISASASTSRAASSSGTPPAQQSTAAASPILLRSDNTPFTLALAVSGLALIGASFILL